MFVCKVCSSEVKPGQAFCPTCGADVVDNYQTVCPVCGTKNVAGSRYCLKCGGVLDVLKKPVCSVCGMKNLPGARFCVSCGAPLSIERESHSGKDMLEARKLKQRLDVMARERMAAVEQEIAEKLAIAEGERELAMLEVEQMKDGLEEDYKKRVDLLEKYKKRMEAFGSEDVDELKKLSQALKEYARYYADPYSQIDEDDIGEDTYVCPMCGRINPISVTACLGCGRNRARAMLLLAKNKIRQSPPIKRKLKVVEPPKVDLKKDKLESLDEFMLKQYAPKKPEQAEQKPQYPQYPQYPYAYPMGGAFIYGAKPGEPYQMPPIVQPVAFVPYVTQDQPLVQIKTPSEDDV